MRARARATAATVAALVLASAAATATDGDLSASADAAALARAVALNLAQPDVMAPAALDSVLAAQRHLPAPARVADWARRYLEEAPTEYRFGLATGGYVDQGLLVPGLRHDCISLLYRTTELARARDARDAVRLALAVRFAGAAPREVVGPDGRADYDHPRHLDFALDMVRSGHWGRDITATLAGAVLDSAGSARYAPGSFAYLPSRAVAAVEASLREGDLVWLVLDPNDRRALALRREHGPVIGHAGIVLRRGGEVWMVHAASRPLAPWYDRTGVVAVPLLEYLQRVERYAGVVVTRLATDPAE